MQGSNPQGLSHIAFGLKKRSRLFSVEGDRFAKFVSELTLYGTNKCLKALAYHPASGGEFPFSLQRSATLLRRRCPPPLKVSFRERFLSYHPYLWIFFFFPPVL